MTDAVGDDEIWFWGDTHTEAEQRFLTAIRARAERWDTLGVRRNDTQAWPDNNPFCVHVDLVDASHDLIYGVLRVDYDGARLVGGWSDGQLVHPIDLMAPAAFETSAFASPEEAAEIAGRWLEAQLCRPIERRERHVGVGRPYELWVLGDTEHELCGRAYDLPGVGDMAVVQLRPARTPPIG